MKIEANVILSSYVREDIATGMVEIEFNEPVRLMGDKTGRVHVAIELAARPHLDPSKVYRLTIEEVAE